MAEFDNPGAIIAYDGDCGICNRWVAFVIRRDREKKFHFAALNSETVRRRVTDQSLLDGTTMLLITSSGVFTRSTAALKIARELSGYATGAKLLLKLPGSFRDSIYNFIASHRHSLLKRGNSSCAFIPGAAGRFLP